MEIKIGARIGKTTVIGALVKGPWDGQFWTNRNHAGQIFLEGPRGGVKRAFLTRTQQGYRLSKPEKMEGNFKREWREVNPQSGKTITRQDGTWTI